MSKDVIDGLNAAWTLAHSRERTPIPPYLLTDAVHEIERLRAVLKDLADAKEPPEDPQPGDLDWRYMALEMKRVAQINLEQR